MYSGRGRSSCSAGCSLTDRQPMRCILLGAATAFYSTYAARGSTRESGCACVCACECVSVCGVRACVCLYWGVVCFIHFLCVQQRGNNKKKGIRAVQALLTTTSTLMITTTIATLRANYNNNSK